MDYFWRFEYNLCDLDNPLTNCMDSYGFNQIIIEATRVANTSAKLLDPIYVNCN